MAARTTSAVVAPARSISLQSLALFGALLALVLASAFGVIHSSHDCRRLYAVLLELEADKWDLQEDYGRGLLEQSTWASNYRVERVATRELNMQAPELEGLKVVRP